jgi:hypothetical protein
MTPRRRGPGLAEAALAGRPLPAALGHPRSALRMQRQPDPFHLCDHCYAEAIARRFGHAQWGNHPRNHTTDGNWRKPYQWNANGKEFKNKYGRRQRVFCASMADVFDNQVPPQWRRDLFALIRKCRRLDWLVLTKRPQNICKMLPADWGDGYRNVWLGMTALLHYEWITWVGAPLLVERRNAFAAAIRDDVTNPVHDGALAAPGG